MDGIEIYPLTVPGPAWSTIVRLRKGRQHTRRAIRYLENAKLPVVLGYGFEGEVAAIRRPSCRGRTAMPICELRAIGPITVTHPNVRVAHPVGFEGYFLAIGGVAGLPDNSPAGQEPHGRSQGMPLIFQLAPPNGVPR